MIKAVPNETRRVIPPHEERIKNPFSIADHKGRSENNRDLFG